jgi:two-component system response regulator ResD
MRNVLVVDDDPVMRQLLVQYLTAANYVAFEAANGREAVRIAIDTEIHLAVVDQTLGEKNEGLNVAAAISAVRPCVRCLLLSGHSQPGSGLAASTISNIAFLQKPFVADSLVAAVRYVLSEPCWPGAKTAEPD